MVMADKTLYHNAARIRDELGKGAEILRQQVVTNIGSESHLMLLAEVDCVLRAVYVTSTHTTTIAAGTAQVQRRSPGATMQVNMSAAAALATLIPDRFDVGEVPLTDIEVSRGDLVYVDIAALTNNARVSIHLCWMPNVWSDDEPRTYATPA